MKIVGKGRLKKKGMLGKHFNSILILLSVMICSSSYTPGDLETGIGAN